MTVTAPTATETNGDSSRLPSGWRIARLGEVIAEAQPGFACGERDPHGVIQLRMNNVDTRGRMLWDEFIRVPANHQTTTRFRLAPGDVLFNNTNSVELVGKTALFGGQDEPVVYSNHFTRLRVQPDLCEAAYLAAWLVHQWNAGTFESLCDRWIGQSAVKNDKLLSLAIPLPPLLEQQRIAARFREQMEAIERARRAAQAELEAATKVFRAYIRQAFTCEEAVAWPREPVGSLIVRPLKTGISGPALSTSKKRCLTLSAVRNGILDLSRSKPVEVSDAGAVGNWVEPGLWYVVRGNGNISLVGRGGLAPTEPTTPVLYPDLLIRVALDDSKVSQDFLRFAWDCPEVRRDIESRARTSAGIHKINQTNLAEVRIPIPPHAIQRETVNFLRQKQQTCEGMRADAQATLEAVDHLPAALLREIFVEGSDR